MLLLRFVSLTVPQALQEDSRIFSKYLPGRYFKGEFPFEVNILRYFIFASLDTWMPDKYIFFFRGDGSRNIIPAGLDISIVIHS